MSKNDEQLQPAKSAKGKVRPEPRRILAIQPGETQPPQPQPPPVPVSVTSLLVIAAGAQFGIVHCDIPVLMLREIATTLGDLADAKIAGLRAEMAVAEAKAKAAAEAEPAEPDKPAES